MATVLPQLPSFGGQLGQGLGKSILQALQQQQQQAQSQRAYRDLVSVLQGLGYNTGQLENLNPQTMMGAKALYRQTQPYTLAPGHKRMIGNRPVAVNQPMPEPAKKTKVTAYKNGKAVPMMIPEQGYNRYIQALRQRGYTFDEPRKGYQRDQKIRQYMDQYGISRNLATKYVDGQIEIHENALGQPVIIDKMTGQERGVIGPSRGGETLPPPQPEGQDQQGDAYITPETAQEGTGVKSFVKQGINNMIGWMTEGLPFEDTAEARNKLRTFNHNAIQSLVINPRAPVAEQRTIKNMLPDPDKAMKDPDEAVQQMESLRSFLKKQIKQKQKILKSRNVSADQRKTYTDQINNITTVLNMMGPGEESGQNRFSDMPKNRFLSINPSSLSDEELEQYEKELQRRMK